MRAIPLRYLVDLNREVVPEGTSDDLTFRYIDISQVTSTGDVLMPPELMTFAEAPSRARRLAQAGDTVVSTVRTYLRAIAEVPRSSEPLVFSTGFAVLAPTAINSRFLAYSCRSQALIDEIVARSTGVSYPAINPSDLLEITIMVPKVDQQRQIAAFLDDRVVRIDQIIAARREQIRLISETYSAWLDALISRFRQLPLRRFLRRIEQGWSPIADSVPAINGESGVLKLGAVRNGDFHPEQNKAFLRDSAPRERYRVRQGDLLITRANTATLVGDAGVVKDVGDVPLYLSDLIYRVELSGYDADLASAALRTSHVRQLIGVVARGTSGSMPKLRGEDLAELPLPIVPAEDQVATAALEMAERETRDREIAHLSQSIHLLTEYKSSLITAAVNGEIDVTTAGSGIPG